MRVGPSLAWVLEFTVFLLRQIHITSAVRNPFTDQDITDQFSYNAMHPLKASPTPLTFFFHSHLRQALAKALVLTRLVRQSIHSSLTNKGTKDNLGSESMAILRQVEHLISRTYLCELPVLAFLKGLDQMTKEASDTSTAVEMFATARLSASCSPLLGQLKTLYQQHLNQFFGVSVPNTAPTAGQKPTGSEPSTLDGTMKSFTGPHEILQCLLGHSQPELFPTISQDPIISYGSQYRVLV